MVFENHGRKIILKYYYTLSVFYSVFDDIVNHPEYMEKLGNKRWKDILFTDYPPETIQKAIDNLLHDWNLYFQEIFKDLSKDNINP